MKVELRKSGLVIPKQITDEQERPRKYRPPLQIQSDGSRAKAREALLLLWDAMGISSGGRGILGDSAAVHDAHYQAYRFIGEMILGDDCPEKAVMT